MVRLAEEAVMSRQSLWVGGALVLVGVAIFGACSGETTEEPAGSSGGSSGGFAGTGGSGGGFAGSGGSGGMDAETDATDETQPGDSAISDAGGDAQIPCAPPTEPSKAALCLTITHDTVIPVLSDQKLDGNGILVVQVYDTPDPDRPDGGSIAPIGEITLPEQDGGVPPPTMSITDKIAPMRFDNLPARVFVRAYFFDNFDALVVGPTYGTWIGGYDFSNGLYGVGPILEVVLPTGKGTNHVLPLTTLRKLEVTLTLANVIAPVGDGQGPVSVSLVDSKQANAMSPLFGIARKSCGDITTPGGVTVDGFVIGTGPYYAFGAVYDFGTRPGVALPPGTIFDFQVDPDGGPGSIPDAAQVVYPANAYVVTKSVELNVVMPSGDAGAPDADTVHCAPGDAGADVDAGPSGDASSDASGD